MIDFEQVSFRSFVISSVIDFTWNKKSFMMTVPNTHRRAANDCSNKGFSPLSWSNADIGLAVGNKAMEALRVKGNERSLFL